MHARMHVRVNHPLRVLQGKAHRIHPAWRNLVATHRFVRVPSTLTRAGGSLPTVCALCRCAFAVCAFVSGGRAPPALFRPGARGRRLLRLARLCCVARAGSIVANSSLSFWADAVMSWTDVTRSWADVPVAPAPWAAPSGAVHSTSSRGIRWSTEPLRVLRRFRR
jgi:hypothetical protein